MRSALGKASLREDAISHTHKDKPIQSPILATISHFHIFNSQNCGALLVLLCLSNKSSFYLEKGLLKMFGYEAKGKNNITVIFCLSFKEITS